MKDKLLSKVKAGIRDEKDGIKYYSGYTDEDFKRLTPKEKKNIKDALKDEKEHLEYLKQDERTILKRK